MNIELTERHLSKQHISDKKIVLIEDTNKSTSINELLYLNSIQDIYLTGYLRINGKTTVKLHIELYASGEDCLIFPQIIEDCLEEDLKEYYNKYEITNNKFKLLVERTVKNFLISKTVTTDCYINEVYNGFELTDYLQDGYLRSEDIHFKYKGNNYNFVTGSYNIVKNKSFDEISTFDEKLTMENILKSLDNI